MSVISEQVHYLRSLAADQTPEAFYEVFDALNNAANTIESLSSKLAAANIERSAENKYDEMRKELKSSIIDLDADHYNLSEFMKAIDDVFLKYRNELLQPAEDCCSGWIYCGDGENLPKEPFACIVTVIDAEPMTMTDFESILPYQVGYSGGAWNDSDGRRIPFDVIAWVKAPTEPCPYHEP